MTRDQAIKIIGNRVRYDDGVKPHFGIIAKVYMNAFSGGEWTARVEFEEGLTLNCPIVSLTPAPIISRRCKALLTGIAQ